MKPDEAAPRSKKLGEPEPPDAVLVLRAQAGDTVAFRTLIERHRDRAYTLALRYALLHMYFQGNEPK